MPSSKPAAVSTTKARSLHKPSEKRQSMAETAKKAANPEADAKNWEQRLHSEQEAPHKWNEAWGSLFNNGVPHDYNERIKYYEDKLKSKPNLRIPSKYGVGQPFREPTSVDFRRKKMFGNPCDDDED
jgi:hypothetical protein